MKAADRRALGLVLAALAVGIAVWAVGRLRPGVDGELARHGGTVVPIHYDRAPAVQHALRAMAHPLGASAEVRIVDGTPVLLLAAGLDPGPGFLPPRPSNDGRRLFRPTPDRAERWRKRAFNGLVERLDRRLEALPRGRGQATLPGAGELQLELTLDAPLDWLPVIVEPGHLTLWRDGRAVAGPLDVIGITLEGASLELALRDAAHPGAGPLDAYVDGRPLARGSAAASGVITLTVQHTTSDEAYLQAKMKLESGPLPLPARAGEPRRLGTAR